jgi:hypothetical protein
MIMAKMMMIMTTRIIIIINIFTAARNNWTSLGPAQ